MNSPYTNDLWIDYKSDADGFQFDPTPGTSRSWLPGTLLKASKVRRDSQRRRKPGKRSPVQGAVRLNSRSEPRRQIGKVSVLALLVAGCCGIVATTASTSNVTASSFKSALLTSVQEDSVPVPTFRFDDADSVSGDAMQVAYASTQASDSTRLHKPVSQAFAPQAIASLWPKSSLVATDVQPTSNDAVQTPGTTAASVDQDPASAANAELSTAIAAGGSLSPLKNRIHSQGLAPADQPTANPNRTDIVTVKAGDTLSGLLAGTSVKTGQRRAILVNELVKKYLSNLRIGTRLHMEYKPDGELASIKVKANRDTRIQMSIQDESTVDVAAIHLPIEYERVVTSGTIEQSLYLAAEKANLNQSTIMALSDIFEWELDFARDIRKGDHFSMVYDRLYRDGKYIGDGDILAAEFMRGDRRHTAIRFTDDAGRTDYYSPDGRSKRRAFMRHPVDVVRITSHFDPNRLHPVLHKIRAHKGVDYGAPYGSPIYATADGKVAFAGSKNAYGITVILKHGDNRSTLYAHMSKLAKKAKAGQRVKRGDVIGYVGKSGRVTGTHLHYEFRIAGKHVDPLKVELPSAAPLDKQYLGRLKSTAQELFAQMRSVQPAANQQLAAID